MMDKGRGFELVSRLEETKEHDRMDGRDSFIKVNGKSKRITSSNSRIKERRRYKEKSEDEDL
jgi:hypothetical protein